MKILFYFISMIDYDYDDNLSVNGKADDDQEIAKGCHHNANLII